MNADDVAGIPRRKRLLRDTIPGNVPLPSSRLSRGLWADVQRHLIQAYEYLCHVGEAKEWIEGCLGEELPFGVVEMEEQLRNGVALARLVRVFQGEGAVRRIYEVSLDLYRARDSREISRSSQAPKLDFRHSDNINHFMAFVRHVGLPEVRVAIVRMFLLFIPYILRGSSSNSQIYTRRRTFRRWYIASMRLGMC